MTISDEIFTRLTTHSGLSALIGTRAFPMKMPQNYKLPCVVYQKIAGIETYSHDGDAGLYRPRYQFSCYANSHSGVEALVVQLKSALTCYSDETLTTPWAVSFMDMEYEQYDPELDLYRVIVDYRIWHG